MKRMDSSTAPDRPLEGRRILFVGVGFFSYDTIIADGLRAMGADVEAVAERPGLLLQSHLLSSPINKLPLLRKRVQRRHEDRLKAQLDDHQFDTVLVLKGDSLGIGFLDLLRRAHPEATFILYQWDSINLIKNFSELRKRFDRCLTFDRRDAASDETLVFRPLFFSRQSKSLEASPHGAVFVGSMHSNRLKLVKQVKSYAEAQGIPVRVYIRMGLFNFVSQFIKGDLRDIHFRALPYETYVAWTKQAEAVLDFPHPLQSGLTMRTLEAIGLGKKIITTNREIANYSFYGSENICVLTEEQPLIPDGFLDRTPAVYDPEIVKRFSLQQWLLDVLDCNSPSDCGSTEAARPW